MAGAWWRVAPEPSSGTSASASQNRTCASTSSRRAGSPRAGPAGRRGTARPSAMRRCPAGTSPARLGPRSRRARVRRSRSGRTSGGSPAEGAERAVDVVEHVRSGVNMSAWRRVRPSAQTVSVRTDSAGRVVRGERVEQHARLGVVDDRRGRRVEAERALTRHPPAARTAIRGGPSRRRAARCRAGRRMLLGAGRHLGDHHDRGTFAVPRDRRGARRARSDARACSRARSGRGAMRIRRYLAPRAARPATVRCSQSATAPSA